MKPGAKVRATLRTLPSLRTVEISILVVIALQLTILGINSLRKDSPIFGLRFEGRRIDNLSGQATKAQIEAAITARETTKLTMAVADSSNVITLRQLGEQADPQKIYTQLLQVGRTGSIAARLADQDLALVGMRTVETASSGFNDQLARRSLALLDKKIDIAPIDAHFVLEHQHVTLKSATNGRVIDSNAALEALHRAHPEQNPVLTLPIRPVFAGVTTSLLQPLVPEVARITSRPLTIKAADSQAVLSPEQLVSLIIPKNMLDPAAKRTTTQLTFDETALSAMVEGVIRQASIAPQPTVINGATVIQPGKSGLQPKDNQALATVLAALHARQTGVSLSDAVVIPMQPVDPPLIQQMANNPRNKTGTGLVRLTFDDGPGAYTEQILDILKRYNVHATFYVIGRNVAGHAATLQRIHAEGHAIGNHSFSHADLTRFSQASIFDELARTQTLIQQTCGVTPTSFRPPYGAQNQTVREVAASLALYVDVWSVDPRDWAQPGSAIITQRVLASDGPGSVVILHVLYQQTVDALPAIIEGIRAQGYTLE